MRILILAVLVATGLTAADHTLPPASSPPPPARRSEPFLPPPGGTPLMPLHENAITSPPPGVPPFMSLPGMPPFMLPHSGSPFPMPPGFPDLTLIRNCTQNTDCSGELRCCWLPCGRKCIPLVPDVTRPEGPKVCPEDILRKLNISIPPSGFPNPSTIKNCSHSTECAQNLKCCLTPYGGKCMPTISYNSSTEGLVNMCPMDLFITLFTPKNQSGGSMMPGPGDHPPIFAPPGDFYPPSMDNIHTQLNTLINGIAAEVKKQVPWKSKEVDNLNDRIKEKVREAFCGLQEKVKAGMDALKTVHKLLKDNKIPKPKIVEILTNAGKACPAGKKEGPWNVAEKIDTVLTSLKKFQLTTPPKSSRP